MISSRFVGRESHAGVKLVAVGVHGNPEDDRISIFIEGVPRNNPREPPIGTPALGLNTLVAEGNEVIIPNRVVSSERHAFDKHGTPSGLAAGKTERVRNRDLAAITVASFLDL